MDIYYLSSIALIIIIIILILIPLIIHRRKNLHKYIREIRFHPTDVRNQPACEVLIIGGGVAGCALASALSRDGRNVTVIEKNMAEPDRIVGELLQPGGFRALKELGLQDCSEGIEAQTVEGYVVENRDTNVVVKYPVGFSGRAMRHGSFVAALRRAAARESKVTFITGNATKLLEDESGRIYGALCAVQEGEKEFLASVTVVADGCFSRLRKQILRKIPTVESHFVALEMLDCPQYKKRYAELIISGENPILVYQISDLKTRILINVKETLPKDLRHYLKETIYHELPEHLMPAFQESVENGKIKVMPNSFLPPSPIHKKGVLCLGDAYNMRHPLTGGGMTVALCDVIILKKKKVPTATLR